MTQRSGVILPFLAVVMLAVLAAAALAIDGGMIKRERRLGQNAADAGALAGAQEIFRNQVYDTVINSARNGATHNGFTDGVNHARVLVDSPTSGTFVGGKYVRVQVWDTVSTILAGILNRNTVVVHSTAIGGIIPPSGDCIVSLEPTLDEGLKVTAGANVQAPGCGIRINSSSSNDALEIQSGSILNATGGSIKVTGGVQGASTPTATTGVTPTPDPLAYLTMPDFSHTCTYNNFVLSSGTQTLNPGTYCNGLTIQGSATVANFAEGDYYILGGGLEIKSGARANSTGSGTTFILTWDATHAYSRMNLQSGATLNLYANTGASAALPGVLFYQDKTVTGNAGQLAGNANQIQSGVGSTFTGTIYFPTQDIEIHSGSSMTMSGGIVASQVWIHDNGTVVNFTNGAASGSAYWNQKRPSIVQ